MYYMATEVYSWRVSSELKARLEQEARARKTSVASVLDTAAREWLEKSSPDESDEEVQVRLNKELEKYIGMFSGDDPNRSQNVSAIVREKLQKKHAKTQRFD